MATTVEELPAACSAEEVLGDAATAPASEDHSASGTAPKGGSAADGEEAEVELTCKYPSGARTNNRALQPVGDRALFVSRAA